MIRGINPQPGAVTYHGGEKLKIFDCELRPSSGKAIHGEIMAVSDEGFLVAAPGGAILARTVQPTGSSKIAASDFAISARLRAGTKLGE